MNNTNFIRYPIPEKEHQVLRNGKVNLWNQWIGLREDIKKLTHKIQLVMGLCVTSSHSTVFSWPLNILSLQKLLYRRRHKGLFRWQLCFWCFLGKMCEGVHMK
ncbi:hypothetical protein Leryth_017122 [Lithospermum erythrorhizon]|nr:hypothetical protein Leryth_017122 [Lithospermum erythrorhizon]